MATARKTFRVEIKEQGRGRATKESFSTLQEAQAFVKSHWQGIDYIGGPTSFHTDYSDFRLVGFSLGDIGEQVPADGYFEWYWKDLSTKPTESHQASHVSPVCVMDYIDPNIPF